MAYKVMKALTRPVREEFWTNDIGENDGIRHYQNLWYDKDVVEEEMHEVDKSGLDGITFEELTESLQVAKNRKATAIDDINTELWKYGGVFFYLRQLQFLLYVLEIEQHSYGLATGYSLAAFQEGK